MEVGPTLPELRANAVLTPQPDCAAAIALDAAIPRLVNTEPLLTDSVRRHPSELPPGAATCRGSLPGWAIDLITDGVRGPSLTRFDVVKATRRVMMSAHRCGWSYPDLHHLLTDTRGRRLAQQIAAGRGGRPMPPGLREEFLRRHWDETRREVETRPKWTGDDVLDFIEEVQTSLDASEMAPRDRAVLQLVIDLANQNNTQRVALPVRVVADQIGKSPATAQRILSRLAQEGIWLSLAQRGRYDPRGVTTGKASLYNLAPALAATYTGATPPMSQAPPMSHPPMSHQEGAAPMPAVALVITDDELEMILRTRKQANPAMPDDTDSHVVYLRPRRASDRRTAPSTAAPHPEEAPQ